MKHVTHIIFSNVVYFVGRAVSGEDSITSFTSRTGFVLRFARRLLQPPRKAVYYLGLDALHRAVFAKASVAEK
jgi:hypothetical protein